MLTPNCKSIEDLANFLNVPKSKTAKAVFFMAQIPEGEELIEKFIFAVIRGDMELNETKLANAVHARDCARQRKTKSRQLSGAGVRATYWVGRAVPGRPQTPSRYTGSPLQIVLDDSIPSSPNLVAGANEDGYHLLNTNYPRDYTADLVTDIAAAEEGFLCPECGHPLRMERGVEVGNIFKLSTRYSDSLGCTFLDREGQPKPVIMGSYGIGVGRLLACVAEQYHDDHGLVWPVTVAHTSAPCTFAR